MRTLNLLAFLPLAPRVPLYGRLLWSLAADDRVPRSHKALLALAAAYVVSPFDLLPDWVPLMGGMDDVIVIVLAIDTFLGGLPPRLIDEKLAELDIPRDELEEDLRRVRKAVPQPIRAVAARVPDAIEGVAEFIDRSGVERQVRQLFLKKPNSKEPA